MSNDDISPEEPESWIEALEEGEADIAAGRVVDGAAIRAMFQASIGRMGRARNTKRNTKKAEAVSGQ